MGPHPEDGEGSGQFSIQDCTEYHREAAAATEKWELGVPASGGGTGGSRARGDNEVGNKEAEHGCAIYCDTTNYGLCERDTWRSGVRVSWKWREQDSIDLEGAKKQAVEKTTRSEPDLEEEADVDLNRDSGGEEESQGESGSSGAEWSKVDE